VRVFRDEAVREFVHIRYAEQHRTVRFQRCDGECVVRGGWIGRRYRRAGTRHDACDVEQIFGGERHARERTRIAARGNRRIDAGCSRERAFRQDGGKGEQTRIDCGDPRERRARAGLCGRRARAHGSSDLRCRHGIKTPAISMSGDNSRAATSSANAAIRRMTATTASKRSPASGIASDRAAAVTYSGTSRASRGVAFSEQLRLGGHRNDLSNTFV
jgi:hypothetical protein